MEVSKKYTLVITTILNLLQEKKKDLFSLFKIQKVKIPKLKRHNEEEKKFRKKMGKYFTSIIGKDELGLGSHIQHIEPLSGGQIGVVVKVTLQNGEKYVLKTMRDSIKIQNEEQYYSIVKEFGLDALEVVERGFIKGNYYIIDKFIDSEGLDSDNEETMQNTMKDLGKYIATLHQKTLNKYYVDIEGVIKETDSEEEFAKNNTYGQETGKFIEDREEFTDEEKNVIKESIQKIANTTDSCLTHNDLGGINNMFKVNGKIIPFDPNADISHPYTDIARFFGNNNDPEQRASFLQGYKEITGNIDEQLLQNFILIGLISKYRSKLKKNKNIDNISKEIKKHIRLLQDNL